MFENTWAVYGAIVTLSATADPSVMGAPVKTSYQVPAESQGTLYRVWGTLRKFARTMTFAEPSVSSKPHTNVFSASDSRKTLIAPLYNAGLNRRCTINER